MKTYIIFSIIATFCLLSCSAHRSVVKVHSPKSQIALKQSVETKMIFGIDDSDAARICGGVDKIVQIKDQLVIPFSGRTIEIYCND